MKGIRNTGLGNEVEIGSDGKVSVPSFLGALVFHRGFKLLNNSFSIPEPLPWGHQVASNWVYSLITWHFPSTTWQSRLKLRSRKIKGDEIKKGGSQRGWYIYKCPCTLPCTLTHTLSPTNAEHPHQCHMPKVCLARISVLHKMHCHWAPKVCFLWFSKYILSYWQIAPISAYPSKISYDSYAWFCFTEFWLYL